MSDAPPLDDRLARGRQIFGELMGPDKLAEMDRVEQSGGIDRDTVRLGWGHAFNDIWGRPGLERQQRSLLTIGMLIAQRQNDELANHFQIALNNGLKPEQLQEVVLHAVAYCGFPTASKARRILRSVLEKQKPQD